MMAAFFIGLLLYKAVFLFFTCQVSSSSDLHIFYENIVAYMIHNYSLLFLIALFYLILKAINNNSHCLLYHLYIVLTCLSRFYIDLS